MEEEGKPQPIPDYFFRESRAVGAEAMPAWDNKQPLPGAASGGKHSCAQSQGPP